MCWMEVQMNLLPETVSTTLMLQAYRMHDSPAALPPPLSTVPSFVVEVLDVVQVLQL